MNWILEPNEMIFFAGRSAILVAALVGFTVGFWRWRRAVTREFQRLLTELEATRGQFAEVASALAGVATRQGALEERIETRAQLSAAASTVPRGYELALRLARQGSSAEEIAETSGVTRQEALLLARLHGPRRTA